jgi:hypothetical protein
VDNAAAAVARMIVTGAAHVPLEHVLPVLLSAMPLKVDFDETPITFKCLNGLVQSQNPAIMNLMPQVLEVYANALAEKSNVEEEVQTEVKQVVRGLFGAFEAQMSELVGKMSPEMQTSLHSALH